MNIAVIGAARGLGKVLALELAQRGHRVIAGVRKKEDINLEAFRHDGITVLQMDVADEQTMTVAVEVLKRENIFIDAAVQTAGVLMDSDREKSLLESDEKDFITAFRINTLGVVFAFRAFYPIMRKGGLYIAETSEGGSFQNAGAYFPAYGVTKTAANKAIQTLRSTVDDIHVIAMHPGRMNTDMGSTTAQIEPEEAAEGICDILEGKTVLEDGKWFIDYRGKEMPL